MKYDLTKHALIEDNGDLVATFNSCLSADRAFKILDDLNNAKHCENLELDLDNANQEYKFLENNNDCLQEKIDDLKDNIEELDDRLQSIITMLEDSSDNYSKEELIKEVIDICAAPL